NVIAESRVELAKLQEQLKRLNQLQEDVAKKFELLMSQTNINPMELRILSNKLSMMSNLAQAARASIMAVKFEVSLYLLRKQTIFWRRVINSFASNQSD